MYDTVNLRLRGYDVPGVSFLEETALYLDEITGQFEHRNGLHVVIGKLGCLTVSIDEAAVRVKQGSLCKWFLGDNVQEMGRGDTRRAIEQLSDTLHLPMERAVVTRIDVAHNLLMRYPPGVYCNHLGGLRYATRLQEPEGIYYKQGAGRLAFYDKTRETQRGGGSIPEICTGNNILRYERRFDKRLTHYLQEPEITAATLYNEAFYIKVVKMWLRAYRDIDKINDITINPDVMKSKKDFDRAARLALVEKYGGEAATMEAIKEMQQRGDITKKQAFDMRKTVKEACLSGVGLFVQSEVITELDRKVTEAAAYYR
jgi:hypothetical protein